jgi:hypothetical protein
VFGNLNFDDALKAVREGKELFVPFSSEGIQAKSGGNGKIVTRAGMGDFIRSAKARVRHHNPIAPNQADYVNWILWDRISYAAGTTVPVLSKLFVAPIGQGGKTKVDTNLELVSSLPAPQWFNICGLGFHFNQDIAPVDFAAYIATEYMELWVSQKVYLEGPLDQFPSPGGAFGLFAQAAAAATGVTMTNNGWPSVHDLYDVRLPAGLALGKDQTGTPVVADGIIGITILQSQTFHIELKADGGGATLAAANAALFPGTGVTNRANLHGILSRGVQ